MPDFVLDARREILTVSELTHRVRALLESDQGLTDVWVRGEVSNYTSHSSGHMYFSLKDTGAQVRCVMWRESADRLSFAPEDGMKVLAFGRVGVYERAGQYQLYVEDLRPEGVGELYLAYVRLKEALAKEGLFDERHKKPLPPHPGRVALVTSSTGAAVHDMVRVLRSRNPAVDILIVPTLVQGEGAPASIVRSLGLLNDHRLADLAIVGRGGGSIEDLWAFNDETVARAVFASRIPIISAVGHETDFTISDFVADVRAPTPTAAAQMAVPEISRLLADMMERLGRVGGLSIERLRADRGALRSIAGGAAFRVMARRVRERRQDVDDLTRRLRLALAGRARLDRAALASAVRAMYGVRARVPAGRAKVRGVCARLPAAGRAGVAVRRERLRALADRLDALSPMAVLGRGYSIARRLPDRRVVSRLAHVREGQNVELLVTDGVITGLVRDKRRRRHGVELDVPRQLNLDDGGD
jgi:exodeoxyribonuclease VII large subunit